jgi:hypothetical protein
MISQPPTSGTFFSFLSFSRERFYLPYDSDQFRSLHADRLANLNGSVGLILPKSRQ